LLLLVVVKKISLSQERKISLSQGRRLSQADLVEKKHGRECDQASFFEVAQDGRVRAVEAQHLLRDQRLGQ